MLLRIGIFLIPCLYIHLRAAAPASVDTIIPSQPLKDGAVLTSNNGAFALGFFSPGNSTTRRYVGIWYAKVSVQTVVWVANRDNPIDGPAGVLSVDDQGGLVLSSLQGSVWSTSTNSSLVLANSTSAVQLLDSGNLVLWNAAPDGGTRTMSWQSFDHPTHAFLPGMKLGLDRSTGINRVLTSWRSADDPSAGNYTFRVVPDGLPEFILYRGTNPVWRTGPWIGQRWSGVPEMTQAYIFNYSFINSPDEVSVTYYVISPAVTSVFLLDGASGTVQRRTWHDSSGRWTTFWSAPVEDCDQYGKCGVFGVCDPNSGGQFECSCLPGYSPISARDWYLRDATAGCARLERNVSMCGNGEGFVQLSSVKVPVTSRARGDLGMSTDECKKECLRNCSCTGFTTAGAGGCVMLYGDLVDMREYPNGEGEDVYVRVDAVELAISRNTSKGLRAHRKLLVIFLVCAALIAVMAAASFVYWFIRKKNRTRWGEEKEISLWLKETEEGDANNSNLPIFNLETIAASTENFNLGNKLGEGGFGDVYKGKLSSGREIAVKRLAKNSGQGMQEFKSEVRLVAKLQHRNLVKTLGCCAWGEERMLIYEYLPNRSLDYFIFDEEKRQLLDWKKRHNIIVGIARGLLYLHQDSRLRIIHRDLKASNVLLDAAMTPKISDFGMARIFGSDEIQANTKRVVGTYGYMSPEYAMHGLFSVKSDVFSYGVMTIEIITGKKSNGYYNYELSTNLVGHVWKLWQESKARNIVDPTILAIEGSDHVAVADEEEILRCMQVGLLCVQENPNDRPTMSEVVIMLSSNTSAQLSPPKQPAFVRAAVGRHDASGSGATDPSSSSSAAGAHSINELTDTSIEGR